MIMLAQVTFAPVEPAPVPTTIAAIRENPRKFDGRVVRLNGWINRCQRLSCAIDERPASGSEGPGSHLSIGENQKFDDTVKTLVPTYVEFDARFNATCLTSAVCTDRAPELTIVSLRSVVSLEPPSIEN